MTQTRIERATIEITLNGEPRVLAEGTSLAALLAQLELDPRLIVVEHNRTIARDRDTFADIQLADGDTLELVHFVGGG